MFIEPLNAPLLATLAAVAAACSHVSLVSPSLTQLYVKIFMPALPVSSPALV